MSDSRKLGAGKCHTPFCLRILLFLRHGLIGTCWLLVTAEDWQFYQRWLFWGNCRSPIGEFCTTGANISKSSPGNIFRIVGADLVLKSHFLGMKLPTVALLVCGVAFAICKSCPKHFVSIFFHFKFSVFWHRPKFFWKTAKNSAPTVLIRKISAVSIQRTIWSTSLRKYFLPARFCLPEQLENFGFVHY